MCGVSKLCLVVLAKQPPSKSKTEHSGRVKTPRLFFGVGSTPVPSTEQFSEKVFLFAFAHRASGGATPLWINTTVLILRSRRGRVKK